MIASLPMYAHPRLVDAYNRYWQLIHASLSSAGIDSPATLSKVADRYALWTDPDLVMSQTCGMPYRNTLLGKVTIIGTPDFGVENCKPGYYRSAIVVRKEDPRNDITDFRDTVFAFNGPDSQSGYAAPYAHTAAREFWFKNRLETGGHQASAEAVADGRADIAALDAVTWRIIQAYEDCASALRVLTVTEETPGLPYITALGNDRDIIFSAVRNAIDQLDPVDRTALGIKGIIQIPERDYLAVPNPPDNVL